MALRHFLTRPGGLRAARLNPPPGPEGREKRRVGLEDCKSPSPSCRMFLVLFSIVFVLIGPLKPEVEEEVAKYQFLVIFGVFSPPLYSPQEPQAVRQIASLSAGSASWKRSNF